MRITEQQLAEYLALGHELRGVEFKPPGPIRDNYLFAQVAKAALGMANRRDGGTVIIGMEEVNRQLNPVGFAHRSQLESWDYDAISDKLSTYADPYLSFDVQVVELQGCPFVVLNIDEFDDVPVLSRKDYPGVIERGALYTRTRRKPETTEPPRSTELRELLEVAAIKRARRFLQDAAAIGLAPPTVPTDADLFAEQRRAVMP